MSAIIIAKLFGTLVGIVSGLSGWPNVEFFRVALLTVLPIWLEVGVSVMLRVEPGAARSPFWKRADAMADALVFLLVPVAYFSHRVGFHDRAALCLQLFALLFLGAGLFRIVRFLREGLQDGKFEGLPVTYSGYLWPCACLLLGTPWRAALPLIFLALSFLLVWRGLKVPSV